MSVKLPALIIGSVLLLSACTGGEAKYPSGYDRTETNGDIYANRQSVFGEHGFCIGGAPQRKYMAEAAPQVFAKAKVPLATAIKTAEAATGGKAFEAGINRESHAAVYIVKLLKKGKVITVSVSAQSGDVLK